MLFQSKNSRVEYLKSERYLDKIIPTAISCPLIESDTIRDTKDPCPVFDGKIWHLYGSVGSVPDEIWEILHATSKKPEGPWKIERPAKLIGVSGPHVAAPAVIYDEKESLFHMFVQTDFLRVGGTIEHLISKDGNIFTHLDTVIASKPLSMESGIYDPHCSEINGEKYIVYSGMSAVGRPDIFLIKSTSNTWNGRWKRLGKILDHPDVPLQNQHTYEDYEWGLEGAQLIELPNGYILLNAVCFLPEGLRGTRQRVFFAVAKNITGPYQTLGAVITPQADGYNSGENGHATVLCSDGMLYLFYQARVWGREVNHPRWRYCLARVKVEDLIKYIEMVYHVPSIPRTIRHKIKAKDTLTGLKIRRRIRKLTN